VSGLSPDDIAAFVQLFDASDWDNLDLVVGQSELHLSKNTRSAAANSVALPAQRDTSVPVVEEPKPPVPSPGKAVRDSTGMLEVRAPHLGTFYRSPKPGTAPYVEVGQSIQADTEVCLLEVMKLFTTMRAGVSGIIRDVCVTDSALVESGQVLFLVEPAPAA
jgi:acetyl-CoA carboxylase biotin carboxyl carrier protein